MAYSDPQSLTVNAIVTPLPRVAPGTSAAAFANADGTVRLSINYAQGRRTRRQARIDASKIAPDPLISSTNIKHSMSAYLVVDVPPTGYTPAEQKITVDALTKWLTDSAGANLLKLLGGEN